MNNDEIQALMAKLQEAGLNPEDIADGVLWPLFRDGKMSKEDLGTLCSSIGLELAEDFDKDAGAGDGAGNVTESEAEDLKEIKPGESKEEFKEKVEEAKEENKADGAPEDKVEEKTEEEKSEEDKSEDEEWDDVKKNIFKL